MIDQKDLTPIDFVVLNKLIAEFMNEPYYFDKGLGQLKSKRVGWNGEEHEDLPLSYHFSWNWLMPVFKKCRTELTIAIQENRNKILESFKEKHTTKHPLMKIQHNLTFSVYYGDFDIEIVYDWCSQFIKWYNENKIKSNER